MLLESMCDIGYTFESAVAAFVKIRNLTQMANEWEGE